MGGALFVGVRHTMDGKPKEALMNRWTNDFPWRFMMPTFQDQGKELREFVTENPDDPEEWPRVEHDIYLSEYGLVLIDFPSRSVFSMQGYCQPGTLYFSCHSTTWKDEREGLLVMAARKEVDAYFMDYETKDRSKFEVLMPDDEFLEFLKNDDNFPKPLPKGKKWDPFSKFAIDQHKKTRWSFRVKLKPHLWAMKCGDKYDTSRKELQAWLKDHGWKSKIRKGISFKIDDE